MVVVTSRMTSQYRNCFYWALAACLCLQLSIIFGVVQAQERQLDDGRFDYDDGPNGRGPTHWGKILSSTSGEKMWPMCGAKGRHQSPMRITPNIMTTDSQLKDLDACYKPGPADANISINAGSAVEVTVNPEYSGYLTINGITYRPRQFHFHMGSEHKILGHSFPMELHLVHVSVNDSEVRAVISWLFVKGKENPFLEQFVEKLPSPGERGIVRMDHAKLPKLETSYARYQGSLTTPPCTENVTWTVMLWNFPTISDRQIALFREAMPTTNVRPSAPSNNRKFRIRRGS